MSWGGYWFFYHCPRCDTKFKSDVQMVHQPTMGQCPECGAASIFVGETSYNSPENPNIYQETE